MKRNAIFCEVDVQEDFIDEKGALSVHPNHLHWVRMDQLSDTAPILIGSVDSHDYQAWEFNTNDNKGPGGEDPRFPPHCVIGTKGWLRTNQSRKNIQFIHQQQAGITIYDQTDTVFIMKEVYSLFANYWAPDVVEWAYKKLGYSDRDKVPVVIYGVATDYCVKAAALKFAQREAYKTWEVYVVEDAIWGVTEAGHKAGVEEMKSAGVKFISYNDVTKMFNLKKV